MARFLAEGQIALHNGFYRSRVCIIRLHRLPCQPDEIMGDGLREGIEDLMHGAFFPADRQVDHGNIRLMGEHREGSKIYPVKEIPTPFSLAVPEVMLMLKVHPQGHRHGKMILHPMDVVHQQILGFLGNAIIEADAEAANDLRPGLDIQFPGLIPDVGIGHSFHRLIAYLCRPGQPFLSLSDPFPGI